MQQAHERTVAPLHDGDDFSGASLGRAGLLLSNGNAYNVSVQGSPGFGSLYIDVFFLSFDADEGESVTGHKNLSLKFGNSAYFLVILAVGAVFAFGHS